MKHRLRDVLIGVGVGVLITFAFTVKAERVTYTAPEEPSAEPEEVLIEVQVDWTKERVVEEILKVFPDAPIMVEVARCESGFIPHAHNATTDDGGIFQVNEYYHGHRYRELGFTDMKDVQQNLAYARILYDESGLQPWSASRKCWQS